MIFKGWLSVNEAADLLGCTTARVRQLLADGDGRLKGEKVNERAWIVEQKSVEAYLAKEKTVGRKRLGELN